MTGTDPERPAPTLRVVRGEPTAEELAVVTALVAAAGNAGSDDDPGHSCARGRWADPFDLHRRPWQNGPGGWRAAARTS